MKFDFENFNFEQRLIKFVEINSLFYKEDSPALEDYLEIFVTIKKHAFDYDDFYRFIPEFGGNLFHYENKKIKCEEDMLGALKWVIQTAYEDKPILDNIVRDIKLAQKRGI